jgi:uncharacterized protein (TIGR02679 family)
MPADGKRLRSFFGRPGFQRLLERLRLRRDLGRPLAGTLALEAALPEERRAIDQLLRRTTSTGATLTVPLDSVLQQLRASNLADNWEDVVDLVCGPPDQARVLAIAKDAAWAELWKTAGPALPLAGFASPLWMEQLRRTGLLKRLSRDEPSTAERWLRQAALLLGQLPLDEKPLATVAAQLTGNSHSLDADMPLATLVLRGIALRYGCSMPGSAGERRELWAKAGIVCDELSAPVLTFNLSIDGAPPLTAILRAAHAACVPLHLSTRLLLATDWASVVVPPRVFVCENPSVVASASHQTRVVSAPLICLDGEPKTAGWLLLDRLRGAGSEILYHGDFDWKGLAIAQRVFSRVGAQPWRYLVRDYLDAEGVEPLQGSPEPTPWCPELADALIQRQIVIHEEAVISRLLKDLQE